MQKFIQRLLNKFSFLLKVVTGLPAQNQLKQRDLGTILTKRWLGTTD